MPDSEPVFVAHAGHDVACLVHENDAADRLPVVWIHGLTVSYRFWELAMYEDVKQHRSWYSLSLPLHHPSTCEAKFDSCILNEDLLAELVKVPVETILPEGKFHMVGHSLGAFAALNYAAKFPGRVVSVVSVGGFMRGRARGLEGALQFLSKGDRLRKWMFHAGFRLMQSHPFVLRLATTFYAARRLKYFRSPLVKETIDLIFQDVRRHDIEAQRAYFRYLLDMDLFDEVDEIDIPVLMMVGESDPIIPAEHQYKCADRLAGGELHRFEGCGHLPFVEAQEEFEASLLRWLNRFG